MFSPKTQARAVFAAALRCVAVAMALLLLPPAPALAAESPSHPFLGELTGAEGSARTPAGAFEDACGVALDSHGDAYVADYYHDAVDVFAGGTYITQIANTSLGNGPCGLAVDSVGRVYVENWRAEVVRFTPSAYPPVAKTPYGSPTVIDESGTATGVAIDPASGNVYVDDGTYIAEYEPSGHPVEVSGEPVHIDLGPLAEGYGLAISAFHATEGDLYVPDAASGTVRVFGPAGESLPAIDGAGTPQAGFAYLVDSAVAVAPTDGHVYVVDNIEHGSFEHPAAVVDEFNPAGAYRGQIARWITHPPSEPGVIIQHSLIDAEPSGLAIDSAGKVYVTSENSDASESGALDKEGKPLPGSVLYTFGPTSAARTLEVTRTGAGVGAVSSSPAGIACPGACAAEYDQNSQVTLTATPDQNSTFAGWSGACSGTGTCKVTMSAAQSVSAEFAAIPQQTLEVSVSGSGEVTSSPAGIACGATCTEHFNEGSTVTLTATPAPHSRFLEWQGVACDESTQRTCQVTMSHAESLTARFAPIPPQALTVSVGGSGEGTVTSSPVGISCPGACSGGFDEGSTVTLTEITAPGSAFGGWSGGGCSGTAPNCTVAMAQAESVSAGFVSLFAPPPGSSPAPPAPAPSAALPAPPAPAAAGARLKLGKVSVKGRFVILKLRVLGSGSVTATGKGLRAAHAKASGATTVTLRPGLTRAGRHALRKARHGKLKLEVTLTFTPSDGGAPAVVTKIVTFRAT